MSGTPTAVPNLVRIRPRGALGECVKYNSTEILFIYLWPFFGNSPTGQKRRRIFAHDGSNDADSHKDVLFWDFVDIAPHLGGKISKKQFWGRE